MIKVEEAQDRPKQERRRLSLPVKSFLVTLAALWLVGVISLWVAPVHHPHWVPPVAGVLSAFARWDSSWYYRIAAMGYWRWIGFAFFPLYPLLTRGLTDLSGLPLVPAGLLIGWAADLAALVLLARLWLEEAGPRTMRRALWLLLAFPTAFFLVAMYSESLYLLLSVATFLLARRGRFAWAAVMIGLAGLTRANGILLLLPYLAFAWDASRRRIDRAFLRRAALGLIGLAGLGIYVLYSWRLTGNPLQFLAAQQAWYRHFTGGSFSLAYALIHLGYGQGLQTGILDFLAPLVFLAALAFDRGSLSLGDKLYVLFGVLSALVYPSIPDGSVLMSAARLVMPYFPVYRVAAERLTERQWRWTVGVMAIAQIGLFVGFAHWAFVG